MTYTPIQRRNATFQTWALAWTIRPSREERAGNLLSHVRDGACPPIPWQGWGNWWETVILVIFLCCWLSVQQSLSFPWSQKLALGRQRWMNAVPCDIILPSFYFPSGSQFWGSFPKSQWHILTSHPSPVYQKPCKHPINLLTAACPGACTALRCKVTFLSWDLLKDCAMVSETVSF